MKELLIFRTFSFDSLPLDGRTTFSFFKESEDEIEGESISKEIEDTLIPFILNDENCRRILFEELGLYGRYLIASQVAEPFIKRDGQRPGDIDLLLIDANNLKQSVAIQCKHIRTEVLEENGEKFSKLGNIDVGVKQANATRELGFHKTYLMLIITMDVKRQKGKYAPMKHISGEKMGQIYWHSGFGDLHENVGVIFFEMSQQSKKNYKLNMTVMVREHIKARPQEQSNDLSQKVLLFIKRSNNKV